MIEPFRQDNRRRKDRSGQAAAARFVTACNPNPFCRKQLLRAVVAAARIGLHLLQRVEVGDARLVPDFVGHRVASADHKQRLAVLPAEARDAVDQLAAEALRIETAFARNYGIGRGNLLFQLEKPAEELPAGNQPGPVSGRKGCAHTARRTAARKQRIQSHAGCKGFHPPLEPLEHRRVGSLLRAEHHGGAVDAQQGVVHVAGHQYLDFSADMRVDPGQVRIRDVTARFEAHHSLAAVVGGAAADSQQDALRSQLRCLADQDAQPEGAGLLGVAFLLPEGGQSADLRHLDKEVVATAEHRGRNRAQQGVESGHFHAGDVLAESALDQGQGAVAAVGHRHLDNLEMFRLPLDAVGQNGLFEGIGGLDGCRSAFELVGGYENASFHQDKVNK